MFRAAPQQSEQFLEKMSIFQRANEELLYGAMIPEPDYCAGGEGDEVTTRQEKNRRNVVNGASTLFTQDGLIMPRKLCNPCAESQDRQSLHKELLFNQKVGKNVLNQKSELQRALEKHRDHQAKKEAEQQKVMSKTPFEKVLDERARRLENLEKQNDEDDKTQGPVPEFLQVHAKVRGRMDPK